MWATESIQNSRNSSMNVLVIDIGGTHVKVLATGQDAHREFDSGPALTPKRMVSGVRKLVADWPIVIWDAPV
jgi:hexokinase